MTDAGAAVTGRAQVGEQARVLYYVPIIHTAADLGSQAQAIRERLRAHVGQAALDRRDEAIQRMWGAIRDRLLALDVDWRQVRIFQDALPVCGREREIVAQVAAQGSLNHALLALLVEKGATLEGTEEPRALVAELERAKRLAALETAPPASDAQLRALKEEGDRLLERRDAYIAARIDATLRPGETGLIFMGLLHRVDALLPSDIEVRALMPDLPLNR